MKKTFKVLGYNITISKHTKPVDRIRALRKKRGVQGLCRTCGLAVPDKKKNGKPYRTCYVCRSKAVLYKNNKQ